MSFIITESDCYKKRKVRLRNGTYARLSSWHPAPWSVLATWEGNFHGHSYHSDGKIQSDHITPFDIVGFVDEASPQAPQVLPETPALEAGVTVVPIYKTADGNTFESAEAANEYARRKSAHQDLVSAMERGKILGLGYFCGLPFHVDFSRYATDREIVDAKLRIEKIMKNRNEEILTAVDQLLGEGGTYKLIRSDT
jgi:hypothetical protein